MLTITVEGPIHGGKTTVAKLFKEVLTAAGYTVLWPETYSGSQRGAEDKCRVQLQGKEKAVLILERQTPRDEG